MHLSEFCIESLCRDLLDFVRPLAEKRSQTLTADIEPNLPPFHSDSGRIKQILYNLLSNAVKFTPVEGEISLAVARAASDQIRISVTDTGPGIAPSDKTKIFEKFKQLDASETREYTGSGLGLAITKDLVQLLGGTVGVESELGQGSTFYVLVPIQVPEPARDGKIQASPWSKA